MNNRYNPFLHMLSDGDAEGGTPGGEAASPDAPTDLAKAVEMAMQISEMVTDADETYSRAALVATRLVGLGNSLMDGVAKEHAISTTDAPEAGNYALRALTAARPEELVAAFQAINQGYDLAMYAFLEAYKLIQTLLSHPAVEMQIGGVGTIKRMETKRSKRKVKLMLQLQSPKEAERAKLLAVGLTEIEQMVAATVKTSEHGSAAHADALERISTLTAALYERVNAAVKDLPNRYPAAEEDAAHGA